MRNGSKDITVAISPCPNDVYIFGSWILGLLPPGYDLQTSFVWSDVQQLNQSAQEEQFPVVKVSTVQALALESTYDILPCGGAFGLNAGPKLVVREGETGQPLRIGVPGMQTTAMALLNVAASWGFTPIPMVYDEIVEKLLDKEIDGGLLIHETALVYEQYGLSCILDLGAWWKEKSHGLPLPLGSIIVHKKAGGEMKKRIAGHIQKSLSLAGEKKEQILPLLKAMAREMDDQTLQRHIATYVNELTRDMGSAGREAIAVLRSLGQVTKCEHGT